MRRSSRWTLRIALGLLILAAVGGAAVIFLRDSITREILVSRLRSATGMEVKISAVRVGLLSPTISIEGLKLYNRADLEGSPCLNVPEVHIEYDRAALRARELHLTLLRLNLAELSVAVDKLGRSNFEVLKNKDKQAARRQNPAGAWQFTGIDELDITLGKFRQFNLASGRGEEIDFGNKKQILRNVKTEADLSPLGLPLSRGQGSSQEGAGADLSQLLESLLQGP